MSDVSDRRTWCPCKTREFFESCSLTQHFCSHKCWTIGSCGQYAQTFIISFIFSSQCWSKTPDHTVLRWYAKQVAGHNHITQSHHSVNKTWSHKCGERETQDLNFTVIQAIHIHESSIEQHNTSSLSLVTKTAVRDLCHCKNHDHWGCYTYCYIVR